MPSPAPAPDGFTHADADVNGVRLHYVIGGSGPAAVLRGHLIWDTRYSVGHGGDR